MSSYETNVTSVNNSLGITGSLPFEGRWLVGATPAKQIPSHGTDIFGVGYAIDFMAVDEQNRTSSQTSWRSLLSTEPPEIFYAFGKPVYSPVSGTVVSIHNGEPDHEARRSLLTLIPYAAKQRDRIRQGPEAIAGNYVVISPDNTDVYIAIVHLQLDSLVVKEGEHISQGKYIANCGNSGNSSQPHIHIQAMSSADFYNTSGIPLIFSEFKQWEKEAKESKIQRRAFPEADAVVSPN
ncbi:M23 family metallopeptidase [Listeria welshimeri]|nr:M23 family metallopeptidase [Listeria welshimeri]